MVNAFNKSPVYILILSGSYQILRLGKDSLYKENVLCKTDSTLHTPEKISVLKKNNDDNNLPAFCWFGLSLILVYPRFCQHN